MNLITNLICTAYIATGHLCADGTKPLVGFTCAAPRSIPFGTRIYIEGIGYRTVQDRTARKYDGRVDIFVVRGKEAVRFGKRRLKVIIYEK